MYRVVSSSQDPLEGDTWQNSVLKDYEWVVLQTINADEKHGQEPSPTLLVLNPRVPKESSQTSESSEQNKVTIIKELYQCETCKKKFKRKRAFYDHKCERTNKIAECEICHRNFFDSSTLLRHVKLHSGIKPFQCELCHRTFAQKGNYDVHCKSQICVSYNGFGKKRIFKTPKKFQRRKTIADCQKVFECEVCHKTFSLETSLGLHQRIHLPFKCNICNNSFSMKQQVLAHLATHENLELSKIASSWRFVLEDSNVNNCPMNSTESKANHAFQCKICQKPFISQSNLIEHERIHTGQKPFECDICYKRFSSQGALTIHQRRHTGERPYQCPLCPKAFVEKTQFNRHARFHAGVKPYECEFCSRKFSQRANLRNHSRLHTGERPFECDICHKTFIEKRSCDRHKQKHFN